MTAEQHKAVQRCADMLKLSFKEMTGKIQFNLKKDSDIVKVNYSGDILLEKK